MKRFGELVIRWWFKRHYTTFDLVGLAAGVSWSNTHRDVWWIALLCLLVWVGFGNVIEWLYADLLDGKDTLDGDDFNVTSPLIEFDPATNRWTATRVDDGEVIAQGPDPEALAADMLRKLKS